MIVTQDPETSFWTKLYGGYELVNVHPHEQCADRLCDVHGRRGPEPWSGWPLNWREDRGMMEVIDPSSGIGHPSRAQYEYWKTFLPERELSVEMTHGCDGGCRGMYHD